MSLGTSYPLTIVNTPAQLIVLRRLLLLNTNKLSKHHDTCSTYYHIHVILLSSTMDCFVLLLRWTEQQLYNYIL